MRTVVTTVAIFTAFCGGLTLGSVMTDRMMRNRCEARVVDSIANGKPFMFVNGEPVVVMSTLRRNGAVMYRAGREKQ